MITRRTFVQALALLSGGMSVRAASGASSKMKRVWFMPDETAIHQRTWMAFGAHRKIWGRRLLREVQRDLAIIARTIAKYEPVSMLVRKDDLRLAKKLAGPTVELIECPLDDLWIRDTGPAFVITKQGEKAAIDFSFNGWGNKQEFAQDAKVAGFVAEQAGVEVIHTKLVLEGGGIEVDGNGTAIITQSCVLNANRNPGLSKSDCERELKALLGLDKIIWLPGIPGKDITDGHTDFYARFARPGVVLAGYDPDPESFDYAVTKKHLEILRVATDAQNRSLEVTVLEAPKVFNEIYGIEDFAAGYLGFYLCNGAVIAQAFGDPRADHAAKEQLQAVFPNREVVTITIDGIAAGGGSIHCTTQQEPMS